MHVQLYPFSYILHNNGIKFINGVKKKKNALMNHVCKMVGQDYIMFSLK